jgi:cell division protein YceG involved in septum cleavage
MKTLLSIIFIFVFGFSVFGQSVNKLTTPDSEFATVYFYRLKEVSGLDNRNVKVHINQQTVFLMTQGHFIGLKMKPGKYELKMSKNQSEMLLKTESGKTYFVKVSQTAAGYFFAESLTEIAEDLALFQISKLTVLGDGKLKSKSYEFIKATPLEKQTSK